MKITVEGIRENQAEKQVVDIISNALQLAGFEVTVYGPDGVVMRKPIWYTYGKIELVVR